MSLLRLRALPALSRLLPCPLAPLTQASTHARANPPSPLSLLAAEGRSHPARRTRAGAAHCEGPAKRARLSA
eukprot:2932205-Alexandrium_andersonii.AAC.1